MLTSFIDNYYKTLVIDATRESMNEENRPVNRKASFEGHWLL